MNNQNTNVGKPKKVEHVDHIQVPYDSKTMQEFFFANVSDDDVIQVWDGNKKVADDIPRDLMEELKKTGVRFEYRVVSRMKLRPKTRIFGIKVSIDYDRNNPDEIVIVVVSHTNKEFMVKREAISEALKAQFPGIALRYAMSSRMTNCG